MGDEATASAVKAVKEFEEYLGPSGKSSDSSSVEDLRSYISLLIARGLNSSDRLLALARYVYLVKRNDLYLHLTTVLGGQGVYESIGERLEEIAGKAKRDEVFKGFILPPLGSQPEAYQKCTKELLDKLHVSLPPEKVREVLTGNHHRVPVEGFAEMKFTVSALVAWMLTGVLGTIVGAMGGLIGAILALLGILSFAIAYGLLKGMRWAWTLSLVFWAIDVILGLLALPNGILRIVVGGILLLYLTRPHIRAFFE